MKTATQKHTLITILLQLKREYLNQLLINIEFENVMVEWKTRKQLSSAFVLQAMRAVVYIKATCKRLPLPGLQLKTEERNTISVNFVRFSR